MNDRLASIAWMIGILALLAVMNWPDDDAAEASRPLSADTRSAGLAAIARWLDASGVRTSTLRMRFTELARHEQGPAGNLLVVHVPMLLIPEATEITALNAWVAAGNTLVISASLFESPAWHLTGGSVVSATEELSGIRFVVEDIDVEPDDDESEGDAGDDVSRLILDVPGWVAFSGSSRTEMLRAVAQHPLGMNFENVEVPWDGTRMRLRRADDCQPADDDDVGQLCKCASGCATGADRPVYERQDWKAAIEHASSGQAVLWERRLGHGSIIVLGQPSLLGNAAIHERGNRQFAINLIADRLGPEGWVIFDDAHQGANDLYTPRDLLTDTRVFQTLGFLLLCWAVYVLADAGSWERATRKPRQSRTGQADLVRAGGRYLARRLHHHALANGLLAPLRDRLARKWRLPANRALREGLALERGNHDAADELIDALRASGRRRISAVKLHNLILKLRHDIR